MTVAMLRRNLPDLKAEKGEHYADILTNLYKHQMRLVWEEQKAYQQRTRELAAAQGDMTNAGCVQVGRGREPSSERGGRAATTDNRPSAAERAVPRPEVRAFEPNDLQEGPSQDTSGGEFKQENQSNAGTNMGPRATARDNDVGWSRDDKA